jgi:hypothetical protein
MVCDYSFFADIAAFTAELEEAWKKWLDEISDLSDIKMLEFL